VLTGADSVLTGAESVLSGAGFVPPDESSSHSLTFDFLCFLFRFLGDWLPFGGVTSPFDDLDTETATCTKSLIIAP
jgi:hypothetical protein